MVSVPSSRSRTLRCVAVTLIAGFLLTLPLTAPTPPSQAASRHASALSAKHHKRCVRKKRTKKACARKTARGMSGKGSLKPASPRKLYWGARIDGEVYGRADAPWDKTTWDIFEGHTGKRVSIVAFGQPAPWKAPFTRVPFELTAARGAIPLLTMFSDDALLTDIAAGRYDASIRTWARAAREYGKPFWFAWNREMNGRWYSWGKQAAANPSAFVAAWRHLHDVVTAEGATNVTWTWCPNAIFPGSTPLASLYPGDAYVDWTGFDAYNFGLIPHKRDRWKIPYELYKPTYDAVLAVAPSKPMVICETASTEYGGSKAAWITNLLKVQLPMSFPKVRAVSWFNWNIYENGGRYDWPIESSPSAQAAFASGIALPNYAANVYGNLRPLTKVPLPQ